MSFSTILTSESSISVIADADWLRTTITEATNYFPSRTGIQSVATDHSRGDSDPEQLAERILQELQEIIDEQAEGRHDALRLLLKGARGLKTLPRSYFLQNIKCDRAAGPLIGSGFGSVYRGKWDSQDVALKTFRAFILYEHSNNEKFAAFLREIIIWRQLNHPNIHKFLGVENEVLFPRMAIVSHWEPHGNINQTIRELSLTDLTSLRPQWILGIALGLEYLHSHRIVHGDLRGDNILVDEELHIRLTDFGLTTLADSKTRTNGSMSGQTPMAWAAVELMYDLPRPNFACDVYSFGCTCIEIYWRNGQATQEVS
ncbi:hypothetical protein EIP91_005014 [Steccherinum ochraceum]|uniref:Protein kinase domain-containing protein n=1 Tax=Steccherinum ochraceum TaxID=92696 RepID=A0A4R0RG53_9APHY|nr:hypothetical protein EIP91_005014 [Steccherinum ochraceum]